MFHWNPAKKSKVGVVLGQNLGRIRSSVKKKVKKQALSIVFSCFIRGYLLKQKEVVVETPEWKFKANIAGNATSEEH